MKSEITTFLRVSQSSTSVLARCTRIAAAQYGVITAAQALTAGLSPPAVRRLVRNGAWDRVRPSVYRLWTPPASDDRWSQRLWAAGLWLGNAGAVSHRAASLWWRLDGISTAPVELTTSGRHRSSDPSLILHRVVSFDTDDVVVRGGMRITSVPRTLIDLCAVAAPGIVEKAFECALRLGLSDGERIRSALANGGRRPRGAGILAELLDDFPGISTESVLETLVWGLLRDGGVPQPERQYQVRDASGVVVARLDFAYPDALVAIEADGHAYHSTRRDWHRDRERQNILVRLGWKVYRITWDDATRRSRQVVSDIAALCSQEAAPTRS